MRRALCLSIAVVASSAALFSSASAQCVTGGTGGALAGTGQPAGVWDTTLPGVAFTGTLSVVVPGGATVLNSVKLHGVTHTWSGDTHWVLQDPAGINYNLLVRSDATSPGGGGCGADFAGDYEIVDPFTGAVPCSTGNPSMGCPTSIAAGVYIQEFSTWTSGNATLNNVPLESIPLSTGTWTLLVYDWYPPSDNGVLASWDMCFGSPTPPPPPPPLPGAPTLTSPPNASTVSNPATLTWTADPCATGYSIDVDGTVYGPQTGLTYSFSGPIGLHSWRVRGENSAGSGPWTTSWTFTFPAPPTPPICIPGGAGGTLTGAGPTGVWNTSLPGVAFTGTLAVAVPPGSTKIQSLKLNGVTHSWAGDCHAHS